MSPAPRPHPRRTWLALALAAVATLCLSGCVYLRLLELKHQLADFDRHFAVQTGDGLRLNFLHPLLLQSDVTWMGFAPTTTRKLGQSEQWHVSWVKEPAPNVRERQTFEIAFDFYFTDGKLSSLALSESYFALVPKQVVLAGIKSLGGAAIDRKERTAQSNVVLPASESTGAPPRPTRAMITALLGLPTEYQNSGDTITLRYRCLSMAPDGKGKPIDLRLVFDAKSEQLLKTTGQMPLGKVEMNFAPPTSSPKS